MTITPDQNRILYPVFLPEWLETTRTSRMVVNGVARIADPAGRIRYSSSKLVTRLGFLPTGAMLKIESAVPEIELSSSGDFDFPVKILRTGKLSGPVNVELVHETAATKDFSAAAVKVDENTSQVTLAVTLAAGHVVSRVTRLKARATGVWNGHPVIAETTLTVVPVAVPPRKVAMP